MVSLSLYEFLLALQRHDVVVVDGHPVLPGVFCADCREARRGRQGAGRATRQAYPAERSVKWRLAGVWPRCGPGGDQPTQEE